jgi:hypothetical protein
MLKSKKEYMKLWRERNKEEIRLKRQKYVSENKEKLRSYSKDWACKNREKLNEYHRKWYQKKKSLIKQARQDFNLRITTHAKMDFKLFDDCDASILFDSEITSEAIERLVKHLELYRDVYPSRKQIHWLNQH